jgi:hypothetical protein
MREGGEGGGSVTWFFSLAPLDRWFDDEPPLFRRCMTTILGPFPLGFAEAAGGRGEEIEDSILISSPL